jgi:hypothetical protein
MSTAGLRNLLRQRRPIKPADEVTMSTEEVRRSREEVQKEEEVNCPDVQPTATSVLEGRRHAQMIKITVIMIVIIVIIESGRGGLRNLYSSVV